MLQVVNKGNDKATLYPYARPKITERGGREGGTENKNIHQHRRFGFEKMHYQMTLYHNAMQKSQPHVYKKKIDARVDFIFGSHTTYRMESADNIRKPSNSAFGGSFI